VETITLDKKPAILISHDLEEAPMRSINRHGADICQEFLAAYFKVQLTLAAGISTMINRATAGHFLFYPRNAAQSSATQQPSSSAVGVGAGAGPQSGAGQSGTTTSTPATGYSQQPSQGGAYSSSYGGQYGYSTQAPQYGKTMNPAAVKSAVKPAVKPAVHPVASSQPLGNKPAGARFVPGGGQRFQVPSVPPPVSQSVKPIAAMGVVA
jgi:hypothetical protein